jgi:hypothetical protein
MICSVVRASFMSSPKPHGSHSCLAFTASCFPASYPRTSTDLDSQHGHEYSPFHDIVS